MSATAVFTAPGLLAKERIVAGPGFTRWLVPPAALAIHLCIGMAYGFSVFWLPLSKAIGITASIECPADMTLLGQAFTTSCDWEIPTLGWTYTLFFVFLGVSAALWVGYLDVECEPAHTTHVPRSLYQRHRSRRRRRARALGPVGQQLGVALVQADDGVAQMLGGEALVPPPLPLGVDLEQSDYLSLVGANIERPTGVGAR